MGVLLQVIKNRTEKQCFVLYLVAARLLFPNHEQSVKLPDKEIEV